MQDSDRYNLTVNYHYPDGDSDQAEWVKIPPVVGQGYVDGNSNRWRIADVWHIRPKRGPLERGVHVFLEYTTEGNDRLHQIDPAYYRRDIDVEEFVTIRTVGEDSQG